MLADLRRSVARCVRHRRAFLQGRWNVGRCAVCEGPTIFLVLGKHLRSDYRCVRCWSPPRRRALLTVLGERVPDWRSARVHEFGPSIEDVEWFRRRCPGYSHSHYWPDVEPGSYVDGARCEDLERLTMHDDALDLVISQDVFEHLRDPATAAREIRRVLAPGGAHLFTVPIYPSATVVRAEVAESGELVHTLPPDYHGRSLVVREWGADIVDFVQDASGLPTERIVREDRRLGLLGGWLDVFVSVKPARRL